MNVTSALQNETTRRQMGLLVVRTPQGTTAPFRGSPAITRVEAGYHEASRTRTLFLRGADLGGVYDVRVGQLSLPPRLDSRNDTVYVNITGALQNEATRAQMGPVVLRTLGGDTAPLKGAPAVTSVEAGYHAATNTHTLFIRGRDLGGAFDVRIGQLSLPPRIDSINDTVYVNVTKQRMERASGTVALIVRTTGGATEPVGFTWQRQ